MSMLKEFFAIDGDARLFEGLEISKERELCEKYMGRFPVVSITLKNAAGLTYQEACAALRRVIGNEARRFGCLLESELLDAGDKDMYRALTDIKNGRFTMADEILVDSLRTLSQLLAKHYGKKVILLLDEYDVPLDKAFQGGYYAEMVSLLRNMLGGALKTNPNLYFAVLTGCLRGKETLALQNYWINTSGNDAVRYLIHKMGDGVLKSEIETLVAGDTVEKEMHEDLTYNEIYSSVNNVWSLLFMTGYLTQRGILDRGRLRLAIPNMEIRSIFTDQILSMFTENVAGDGEMRKEFWDTKTAGF